MSTGPKSRESEPRTRTRPHPDGEVEGGIDIDGRSHARLDQHLGTLVLPASVPIPNPDAVGVLPEMFVQI
ncbi:hypothetical protein GFS60_07802 (plasmid) [Rhodococcus sp. WAY2]|nr:hypothetical protein GFS60_07802 [Rhodococcus sp. WAY2]